jgi:hypothetical protein
MVKLTAIACKVVARVEQFSEHGLHRADMTTDPQLAAQRVLQIGRR